MLTVGLTGGIGAGKSTVARRLAERGAAVIDADLLAREVLEPGTDGLAAVVETFGSHVLLSDGSLDRPGLGRLAFADDDARRRLNAIVHPRVGARMAEVLARIPEDAVVVHDVPLLVENQLGPGYQLVIVVHAAESERLRRLVADRGMTATDARQRMAAQASDAARRAAADVWVDNGGALEEALSVVDLLWDERLQPFAENVLMHRCAGTSDGVVAYDPTWPAQARRLVARVERAAGPHAVLVEHVGPTSVPGRAAEDVIDVRIALADLTASREVSAALEQAGYPLAPDAAIHCSADPGRGARITMVDARTLAAR